MSPHQQPYKVSVSIRFLIVTILYSCMVAFFLGVGARTLLITKEPQQQQQQQQHRAANNSFNQEQEQKHRPSTIYSTKNFDISYTIPSSFFLNPRVEKQTLSSRRQDKNDAAWNRKPQNQAMVSSSHMNRSVFASKQKEEVEEEHSFLFRGQHVFIDITHLAKDFFLLSERQISKMILTFVEQTIGLSILSYHCHEQSQTNANKHNDGGGMNCAFIAFEKSHVYIQTIPHQKRMIVDIFVSREASSFAVEEWEPSMLPALSHIFDTDIMPSSQQPRIQWSLHPRLQPPLCSTTNAKEYYATEHEETNYIPLLPIPVPGVLTARSSEL